MGKNPYRKEIILETKQLINQYLNDLVIKGYSINTIKAYRHALNNLAHLDITKTTTAELMKILSQEEWDRNTIIARQTAIKSFFKWLQDNKIIQYNPALGLPNIPKKEINFKPISNKDYQEILAAIKKLPISPKIFFLTIINYQLKASEVLSLTPENIDWKQEALIIPKEKGTEIVPFGQDEEYKLLLKQLCNRKNLFPTIRSGESTYDWAYYWWKKIMQKTGLDYTMSQLNAPLATYSA